MANPLDNMTDRDLIVAMRTELDQYKETQGYLQTCSREVTEKLHEFELFKAGLVATGIANEKDIVEKARVEAANTARIWAAVISVITLIVTTSINVWLALRGGL